MSSKNVKILIIVVCLAALAAFLIIKQPWKSGAAPGGAAAPTLGR